MNGIDMRSYIAALDADLVEALGVATDVGELAREGMIESGLVDFEDTNRLFVALLRARQEVEGIRRELGQVAAPAEEVAQRYLSLDLLDDTPEQVARYALHVISEDHIAALAEDKMPPAPIDFDKLRDTVRDFLAMLDHLESLQAREES